MITEKAFISSHQSFWHGLAPMLSQYVKAQNMQLERFSKPFDAKSSDDRGLIGELTFRLFVAKYRKRSGVAELNDAEIATCVTETVQFIRRFRAFSRKPRLITSDEGICEARELEERLGQFFAKEKVTLVMWPQFPGCGWLDTVEGDGVGNSTLYEIKCGQSRIRGKDIRQILCYLSLNHVAKSYEINEVCIFNPRTGLVFRSDVMSLCLGISGVTEPVLLGEIVEYVSEPSWVFDGV